MGTLFNIETGETIETDDGEAAPVHVPTEAEARAERNARLAATDWTQLPDAPVADHEAWAAYRQALRDVPEQPGFPAQIEWPTAPGG